MISDTKIKNGYLTYLRYSKVIELISKKQCTAKQLKITKIPIASLYRILKSLLMNNKIVILKTKRKNKSGRPPTIYKLKRGLLNDSTNKREVTV